ncbi:LysM repeat protein [Bifidobacterium commune]|uniref:LysM domain-containing protein n=1 Tax=Bifidobacterium commune TaxID=1505727 RepID=A0A1C4H002_9BIFI|nr:LysM peptidoglycan-binding domain-containing protein [Bifidobacterium commune]MBB2955190.1 LysM repeat protein [Bifidobacterium commune]SCC78211.1 LysM domain-containing protein [Bifidobacterium commune]
MSEKAGKSSSVRSQAHRRPIAFHRFVVALMLAAVILVSWKIAAPHVANSAEGDANLVGYTVRPGDTLWSYATKITPADKNVGDTVDRLMQLNQLDSAELQPGQRLVVPEA